MNGSLAFGLVMYEKFGLHSGNRNLFDMIISFGSLISILQSGPIMYLVTYRNLFGPFENQNLVFGLLCVHMFGNITYFMITIEGIFVWYITVKVFKNKCDMDEVGMIECIKFFTISLSSGLTFLICNVGYHFHALLMIYLGFPLDFDEKNLYKTRLVFCLFFKELIS